MVLKIGVFFVVVCMWLVPIAIAWPRAASWPEGPAQRSPGDVDLLILHTNDMHSRFDETSQNSGTCTKEMREENKCYGGFARVAHVVNEARKLSQSNDGPPVIFLNAGDTFQGTVWYTVHKHLIVTAMLNKLRPDAVSLGNHEFDDGVAGLAPFVREAAFPVLAANVNVTLEPSLQPKLRPTVELLSVLGTNKIAVIGYLTPETANISFTEHVIFEDEVTAIRREAKKMKERGVNIIIALGHSGYDVDLKIAEEVEDVDVVIGGHTNTFLFSGDAPDTEIPADLYPTVVRQKSGRRVPVVQAYAYTKYMGRLTVTFDNKGEVKHFEGNPQLLNASVPEDLDVKDELEKWRPGVLARTSQVAGRADVLLQGDSNVCRTQECTMGNLMADAFVQYHARRRPPAEDSWTDAAVALQHGGGVRASVEGNHARGNNVSVGDLLQALPFENRMFRCEMKGSRLRQALEWGVRRYDPRRVINDGGFLQMSGLRVVYDVSKPTGKRVRKAEVLCARCRVPSWEPLVDNATYGVLLPHFLLQGGDGYEVLQVISNTPQCSSFNYTDLDVAMEYFKLRSPVTTYLDGRISFNPSVEEVAAMIPTSIASIPISSLCKSVIAALLVSIMGFRNIV